MCYSPIQIKNNSKVYRPLVSKDFLTVPCGKCRECQIQKQNDWYVRLFYEWKRTKSLGGQSFYITLTYNDISLPFVSTHWQKFSFLEHELEAFIKGSHPVKLDDEVRSKLLSRWEHYCDRYGLSLDDYSIPDFSHTSFNRHHVRCFFKNLRQLLHNRNILRYGDEPIKFFLVCEYGDEKKRPHYHVIVFVPVPVNENVFLDLCKRAWSYNVKLSELPNEVGKRLDAMRIHGDNLCNFGIGDKKKWLDWSIERVGSRYRVRHQYGFVSYSVNHPAIIDNILGVKYLTEYLNYYDNYLSNLGFDRLKDYLALFPSLADYKGYENYQECLSDLRDIFPFKRTSYNFGSNMLLEFQCKSRDELVSTLVDNKVYIPSDTNIYRIPRYIKDRIMFERKDVLGLEHPCVFLTSVGYDVMRSQFSESIKDKVMQYKETFQVLSNFLMDSDRDHFKTRFGYTMSFDFIPNLYNLALFDIVFNGVAFKHMTSDLWVYNLTDTDILDNAFDLYLCQQRSRIFCDDTVVLFDDLDYLHMHHKQYLYERTFNSLPEFLDYTRALEIIHYIRNTVLLRDAQSQILKYQRTTAVRDALNVFRYGSLYT